MATQYPAKKGAAFTVVFPILDADGDLVTAAAGLDSEISKDGGTFADCTNEASEIATSSGMYSLVLTTTEMTADIVAIIVKTTTADAKTTPIVIYTSAQTLDEIDANIDSILVDTGTTLENHLTDIKGTGFAKDTHSLPQCLTATGFSTHAAADVWAVGTRALTDKAGFTISGAKTTLDALNDLTAAAVNAEVDTALVDINLDHLIQITSSVSDVGPTDTDFDTALAEATNDHYNNHIILFTSGALSGQARRISDYDGTTKNITEDPAFTEAPADTDTFVILGYTLNEAMRGTDSAALASVCTETRLAELAAANLPSDIDAILVDTGTTLNTHLLDIKGTGFVKDTDSLPQCLTATGFSTHAAADIWTAATRALSTPADYKADVSALALEATLTAMKGATFVEATDSLEALRNQGDAVWITATGFSTHAAADIWAVVTRALTDKADFALSEASRAAVADDVWDEVLTGAAHNDPTSAGRRLRQLSSITIHDGTAQAGTANSITLDAGASATDGIYAGNYVVIVAGTGIGQTRRMCIYNGTTKVAVVTRNWVTNPDNTSEFQILGSVGERHVVCGLATAGAAGTITLEGDASATDDIYNDCLIHISTGTGAGQTRRITDYDGTNKIVSVKPNWQVNPDDTSVYHVLSHGRSDVGEIEGLDASDVINAQCDQAIADYDPPTKGEMDTGFAALNDIAAADIWAVGTRALTDKADFALSSAANLAIWHVLVADIVTADTIGLLLETNVDAAISSRSSHAAADIWTAASRALSTPADYKADVSALALEATLTAIKGAGWATQTLKVIGDYVDCLPASLGDIVTKNEAGLVDSIWDEEIVVGHNTDDTAGEQLNDAAIAVAGADPEAIADAVWNEALSDHIASGSTGEKMYGIRSRVPLSPWKYDDMIKVIDDLDFVRAKIRELDALKKSGDALLSGFKSLQDSISAISKLLAPLKDQGVKFAKLDVVLSKTQQDLKLLAADVKALPVSDDHQRIEVTLKDIRDSIPPPAPEFPAEVNEQLSAISAHSEQLLAQLVEFKRSQESLSKKSDSKLAELHSEVSVLSKLILAESASKLPIETLKSIAKKGGKK